MHWAKLHSKARFNLATSGVAAYPLCELPVTIDQLEINGDHTYGYAPLQTAIAKKANVDPDCVVAAAGTSMANHLAMAALIEPGDEVLIEHPTYELLVSAARPALVVAAAPPAFFFSFSHGFHSLVVRFRRPVSLRHVLDCRRQLKIAQRYIVHTEMASAQLSRHLPASSGALAMFR